MPPAPDVDADRTDLIRRTRKGIGMPVAGCVYWVAVGVSLQLLPLHTALILSFVATGAVFPLGTLFTRLAGGDLFARNRTLTPLGLQLAAIQLFYWPVIVVVFRTAPPWAPFTMAVLFSSHFLPYWWLYRSRGYALLAVLTVVACCVSVALAGDPLTRLVPFLVAACYAVGCALVWGEARAPGAREPVPA